MIKSLSIKNIALIDSLEVEFFDGFNVLSGETGAGKSIIIDSLNFVLGDRADKTLIRHGQNFASVEAVFDIFGNSEVQTKLEEYGFDADDVLIVSRTMNENGRNECRINRKTANLSTLKELVSMLVDIHSQNEHQKLLKPENYIEIIDSYDSKGIFPLLENYKSVIKEYKALKKEIESYSDASERERKIDLYAFQTAEIEKAAVEEGEEDKLIALRAKLNNMERILTSVSSACEVLDGDAGSSAVSDVSTAIAYMRSLGQYGEEYTQLEERLDSVKIELADIAETLKASVDAEEFDERTLGKTESRLRLIREIKRKYGATVAEINEYLTYAKTEYEKLRNAEERLAELNSELCVLSEKLKNCAVALHNRRIEAANRFSAEMLEHIRELGMKDAEFEVEVKLEENVDDYSSGGADDISFLLSPNKGEPPKPLQKVASGGELSRFMLALKTILADAESIGTLIFDEIDTGISGNVAKKVGERMSRIAKRRQVIAVTHLGQIAALADTHYLIEKTSDDVKTRTGLKLLDEKARISEIIRLTGGFSESQASISHAEELKAWADSVKAGF